MSLREIFCQDKAIDILQRAFAVDRMAGSYIFAGREGVGKFRTAKEFAKMLLCKNKFKSGNRTDSCGLCRSCKLFEADSHPDFIHIYKELLKFTKDGKKESAPIDLPKDVIKEFLVEKATVMPALSSRKIFVVSEAEKLNTHSQNALLKVLEEPPAFCTIILLCTRLERLLATTKSRCQIIKFGLIDENKIVEELSVFGVDGEKAMYFARLSQGSVGMACQWAKLEVAGSDIYKTKAKLINLLADFKYEDSLKLAEMFLEAGKKIEADWNEIDDGLSKADINRRALAMIIRIVISFLHDAMMLNGAQRDSHVNFDQKKQVEKLSERLCPEELAERIAYCYQSLQKLGSSVNEKLIFEQMLLNLTISDRIMG